MALETDRDRLLTGSPLRRQRASQIVCAIMLAVLIGALLVNLSVLGSMRPNATGVFWRALSLSTLLSVVPLLIVWYLDRREREAPWLLAAAFLWGGCVATAISLPLNTLFAQIIEGWVARNVAIKDLLGPDAADLLAAPLAGPVVEETAKALGVVLIFWLLRAEFDNMRDGIVYGLVVGIGFNWYEAALYVAQGYDETGAAPFGAQLGARYALLGLGGHALFTALFGALLGLTVQMRRSWLRIAAPLAGLFLAIAAHTMSNAMPLLMALEDRSSRAPRRAARESVPDEGFVQSFLSSTATDLMMFLPFLLIMAVALWRSGVWERRVIAEELAGEVGPVISPDQYQAIADASPWRASPRTSTALARAQRELAFRKHRVRNEGQEPDRDGLVAGWREEIRKLRS